MVVRGATAGGGVFAESLVIVLSAGFWQAAIASAVIARFARGRARESMECVIMDWFRSERRNTGLSTDGSQLRSEIVMD